LFPGRQLFALFQDTLGTQGIWEGRQFVETKELRVTLLIT